MTFSHPYLITAILALLPTRMAIRAGNLLISRSFLVEVTPSMPTPAVTCLSASVQILLGPVQPQPSNINVSRHGTMHYFF